jgi:deoxyribonuclease V
MAVTPVLSHRWDLTTAEARALQRQLSARVVTEDRLADPVRLVAGADLSYDKGCPTLYAAVVVLDAVTGALVESRSVQREATFPYVPGYLSFREIPPLLEAFALVERRPDLVICDGQGLAHPRRLGLACHLGVLLDLPSIGCGKTRLVGRHREPGLRRGSSCRLLDGEEVIGRVLRTRTGVKPVYVSTGHRVCLETARRWVLKLAHPYRLPEPVRAAHSTVNRLRAEARGQGAM